MPARRDRQASRVFPRACPRNHRGAHTRRTPVQDDVPGHLVGSFRARTWSARVFALEHGRDPADLHATVVELMRRLTLRAP